jgi:hypothetical protein
MVNLSRGGAEMSEFYQGVRVTITDSDSEYYGHEGTVEEVNGNGKVITVRPDGAIDSVPYLSGKLDIIDPETAN